MRQLRYFMAVAEAQHFRRAGVQLNVSQSALSKQVKLLEEEVGAELLARTSRKVALTPAGLLFLKRAQMILQAADDATSEALQATRGLAGVFSIGFVSTASFDYLPRLVAAIRTTLPNVQVQLREWSAVVQLKALEDGNLDLALLQATSLPSSLEAMQVAKERLYIALPQSHPLAKKRSVDPKDLASEILFVPQKELSPALYEAVVGVFLSSGHVPITAQAVEQVQTALCLTAAGLGVSVVPESARGFGDRVVFKPLKSTVLQLQLLASWRRVNQAPILTRVKQLLLPIA